jgi:hypothetical protein
MGREMDMIRMKLKPIVCALTIGSTAIANAGCNADSPVVSLLLDANPVAHYMFASAPQSDAAASVGTSAENGEHATHAEGRHFAIYNRYRWIAEASGSSGAGATAGANGAGDEADEKRAGNFLLWGSRLLGIEHLFCPADDSGK